MYIIEENEQIEAALSDEAQRQLVNEQILIDAVEAEAEEDSIEDNDELPERKLLKRELKTQALQRLEDTARTVKDFKNIAAWWDKLDANRERKQRYHEILRSNDDIPLEYGASFDARCLPDTLNSMLEKQNRRGDFLGAIFFCPYEIHQLVTYEYISKIILELRPKVSAFLMCNSSVQFHENCCRKRAVGQKYPQDTQYYAEKDTKKSAYRAY